MGSVEVVEFNGKTYRRYPESVSHTTYFRCGANGPMYHRDIWEFHNGPIPDGMIVHHIDENPSNNNISNLQIMTQAEHNKLHAETRSDEYVRRNKEVMDKIRPLTNAWRRSEVGQKWYSEHGKRIFRNREERTCICLACNEQYQTKHKGESRFCSRKCIMAARRESKVDYETRLCLWCDAEFRTNKHQNVRCCSKSCGAKKWRHERREAKKRKEDS